MLWLLMAILSLLAGLGFLVAGKRCLQKDRLHNRRSMSAVTRILHAVGFIGIGVACYTICFWFEDEVFDSRYDWNRLEVILITCSCIALVWIVIAVIYLITGPLYFSRSKRAAAAARMTTSTPRTNRELDSAHTDFCTNASSHAGFCPQCGNALLQGQRFCPVCGFQIMETERPAARVCEFCGERAEEGLVYCAKCGHRL